VTTPPHGRRVRPYSAKEQAVLYSWANRLTTALKRHNARALLGLAGGAGLTALELMAIKVEDVELAGTRAFVNVNVNVSGLVASPFGRTGCAPSPTMSIPAPTGICSTPTDWRSTRPTNSNASSATTPAHDGRPRPGCPPAG